MNTAAPTEASYTVREMTDADWPLVQAGFAHSFLDCHTPETWDWKFRTHQPQAWRGWVACHPQDGVIAFLGATAHRAQLNGTEATVLHGSDSFSHPQWRNGGKHSPYVHMETAFQAHQRGFAVLGLGFGLNRRMKLGFLAGNLQPFQGGAWLQSPVVPSTAQPGCSVQLGIAHFEHTEWTELWAQRSQQVRWSLVRDQAFLAWRFDPRQGHIYHCFALRSATAPIPLGYMVWRLTGGTQAVLVDCVLPTQPQQVRDAWTQLVHWLGRQGITQVVTYMANACPEQRALRQLGWSSCPPPLPVLPGFTLYSSQCSAQDINQHYALTLADTDLY